MFQEGKLPLSAYWGTCKTYNLVFSLLRHCKAACRGPNIWSANVHNSGVLLRHQMGSHSHSEEHTGNCDIVYYYLITLSTFFDIYTYILICMITIGIWALMSDLLITLLHLLIVIVTWFKFTLSIINTILCPSRISSSSIMYLHSVQFAVVENP